MKTKIATINYLSKSIGLIIPILTILLASTIWSNAQTSTNASGWLPLNGTNYVLIPYGEMDVSTHKIGEGVALLYKVTPQFLTGLRFENSNGQKIEAGVQGQLQTTITNAIFGLSVTPFVETSVGIGNSALYGSAGPGAFLDIYSHNFSKWTLQIGAVGDYEHYVNGTANGNKACFGPLIHATW